VQANDRDDAIRLLLVSGVTAHRRSRDRVETIALGPIADYLGPKGLLHVADACGHVWFGDEVVVPTWIGGRATLRGDDEDPAAVPEVGQGGPDLPARLAAAGSQDQNRHAKNLATQAQAVQRAVNGSGDPEGSRRPGSHETGTPVGDRMFRCFSLADRLSGGQCPGQAAARRWY